MISLGDGVLLYTIRGYLQTYENDGNLYYYLILHNKHTNKNFYDNIKLWMTLI